MKRNAAIAITLATLVGSAGVHARDDQRMYPLADALASPAAQGKLDPAVKLFFGNQPHPAVAKEMGEWRTNKKTNGLNKSDQEACEWVFLSAVLELQERAQKEGGNAVINIRSNYKNNERSSETEYMCGSGALMSGVALKGTVVKIAN